MKILTYPKDIEEIKQTENLVDGFIIGIKDMSINANMYIDDLDTLKNINKEIFVSLNKNMHNNDLEYLKELLIKLNNYNIKAVLYYDIAVLSIYKKLNLNYDLVWHQEHSTTNYNTINYWNNLGINYTYLSSDITEEEIIDISKNTNSKLIVNLFGYLPMFVSKRRIVKNYLNYFKLEDNSSVNYIEKENNIYPIIDTKIGTTVYSSNILNGIKSMLNINIDYAVLNSFGIELNEFIDIIKMFKSVDKNNVIEYDKRINNMFSNIDNGFLNKRTIYKVKKDEKKA